jgi:hypothetical protein
MGEQGARAVGQHGREPMAFAGQPSVADCVHPSVHAMKPARARASGHRLPAQPKAQELGKGDDPVLPCGELL